MANERYDIITVGGGLGGSSLAKAMAERGARVLVLERERQFRDRVRGEVIWPWGVAELKELGSYDLLRTACGHDICWFDTHLGPARADHNDLVHNTVPQVPALNFYHPEMQEVLLQAAGDAGADIRRGAWVCDVKPGVTPIVRHRQELTYRFSVRVKDIVPLAMKFCWFDVKRRIICIRDL